MTDSGNTKPGFVYDAAKTGLILGVPCECTDSVPAVRNNELVVYYGGWDLPFLRNSTAGQRWMCQNPDQRRFDHMKWSAPVGYYRVPRRIFESNNMTWDEQLGLARLKSTEPAPIVVAVTAVLVHYVETHDDFLWWNWCRCADALPEGYRAAMCMADGVIRIGDVDDNARDGWMWLAAATKC